MYSIDRFNTCRDRAIKHNTRKVEWYAKDGIVIQINIV